MDRSGRTLPSAKTPSYESVLAQLKKDIVSGALAPDEKLRIRMLTSRYGVGASPMREALARLSGTGLVRLDAQKGFRVAPIGHADLVDITCTRQIMEAEALALSINLGDDAWEGEILKSFHLLCKEISRRGDGSEEWLEHFEARHHDFHRCLIAACPLKALKSYCDDLYLRSERYRRILFGYAFKQSELQGEHEMLMQAVLSRDLDTARTSLIRHIGLTADILASLLPQ